MNIIEKSLAIALTAYSGRQDQAGGASILHPLRVMGRMTTEDEMAAALLHQVVEGSTYTSKGLMEAGIPSHVVGAVECLSRVEGESDENFISRVQSNPLATAVMIADLKDHMDLQRFNRLGDEELAHVAGYHKAWKQLTQS
ncbi:GTP pyrophosphokinase [Desulfoluna spongiiphila]|nr:GTP pyrophosphokinase [Desulfoluna spongiiphila]VVS91582.1 hypothetical protein DBB_11500 [Desulfoluna spongiiphila]